MQNYQYRSNDYMRRSQYSRPAAITPQNSDCKISALPEKPAEQHCTYDSLKGLPLAMAYVPWQDFNDLYATEKALCRGTIFQKLDKPFSGKGGCCR